MTREFAIGVEVETPWPVMLARVDCDAAELLKSAGKFSKLEPADAARVQAAFDRVDDEFAERFDSVFGERIVRGKDSYREFAVQPQADSEALLRIVGELYGADILREGEVYPLQITLGNVAPSQLAYHGLMATEICDGTTAQRMREINTWSRRGTGGLHPRKSRELQLGMKTGVEYRSLVLTGQETFGSALRVAEACGRLAVAKAGGSAEAGIIGRNLREVLKDGCAEAQVAVTHTWWNPQGEPGPWERYASLLEDESWRGKMKNDIFSLLAPVL